MNRASLLAHFFKNALGCKGTRGLKAKSENIIIIFLLLLCTVSMVEMASSHHQTCS